MYWLHPPPVLRRIGAVVLVLGALVWDLQGGASQPYPVAAIPIPSGATITVDAVGWIDLPEGMLPVSDPLGHSAATDIAPGEPLSAAVLAAPVAIPDDWWTIPVAIGSLARPGDAVLLVVADPPLSTVGLVVAPQVGDPYDLDHRPGSVAVPASAAPFVAAAEQQGLLVTAIRSTAGDR